MGDELSSGQARDWYTHTHRPTDAGDDNTRRPKQASGKKHKPSMEFLDNLLQLLRKTFWAANCNEEMMDLSLMENVNYSSWKADS